MSFGDVLLTGLMLVSLFLTTWVWIDKRNPRKYDTFFEFAPYEMKAFDEAEAVRWTSADGTKLKMDAGGNKVETGVRFKRGVGGKANTFFEDGTGAEFKINGMTKSGESFMTAALKLKPEPTDDTVRFNAKLGGRSTVS